MNQRFRVCAPEIFCEKFQIRILLTAADSASDGIGLAACINLYRGILDVINPACVVGVGPGGNF